MLDLVGLDRERAPPGRHAIRVDPHLEVPRRRHHQIPRPPLELDLDRRRIDDRDPVAIGQILDHHGHHLEAPVEALPRCAVEPEARGEGARDDALAPTLARQRDVALQPGLPAAMGRAAQERFESLAQLSGRRDPLEPRSPRDRHLAPLLRHDDAEGIASLGEPETCGVARPAAADLAPLGRERQVDTESRHLPAPDHDRPVVSRRPRIDEAPQQGIRDPTVEKEAAIEQPLEGLAPGQDEERTDPAVGQRMRQLRELCEEIGGGPRRRVADHEHRDALEQPPQVVLEHDHEHQRSHGDEALEQRRRQAEIQPLRSPEEHRDREYAPERDASPSLAHPGDQDPEQAGDDRDVEHVDDAKGAEDRSHPAPPRRQPPAGPREVASRFEGP